MFSDEIVNAEVQRHGELVHFKAFAVAKPLAFKSLQFLSHGQKCAFYVARGGG